MWQAEFEWNRIAVGLAYGWTGEWMRQAIKNSEGQRTIYTVPLECRMARAATAFIRVAGSSRITTDPPKLVAVANCVRRVLDYYGADNLGGHIMLIGTGVSRSREFGTHAQELLAAGRAAQRAIGATPDNSLVGSLCPDLGLHVQSSAFSVPMAIALTFEMPLVCQAATQGSVTEHCSDARLDAEIFEAIRNGERVELAEMASAATRSFRRSRTDICNDTAAWLEWLIASSGAIGIAGSPDDECVSLLFDPSNAATTCDLEHAWNAVSDAGLTPLFIWNTRTHQCCFPCNSDDNSQLRPHSPECVAENLGSNHILSETDFEMALRRALNQRSLREPESDLSPARY